jgi:hypothetical protein
MHFISLKTHYPDSDANQSLFLILNAACLVEKSNKYQFQSLI